MWYKQYLIATGHCRVGGLAFIWMHHSFIWPNQISRSLLMLHHIWGSTSTELHGVPISFQQSGSERRNAMLGSMATVVTLNVMKWWRHSIDLWSAKIGWLVYALKLGGPLACRNTKRDVIYEYLGRIRCNVCGTYAQAGTKGAEGEKRGHTVCLFVLTVAI